MQGVSGDELELDRLDPENSAHGAKVKSPITIIVSPIGGLFESRHGGEVVCRSRQPLFDSARELIARGADPDSILAMRHFGSDHDAMSGRLGTLAELTVEDSPRGVTVRPFREGLASAVAASPVAQIDSRNAYQRAGADDATAIP